MNILVNGSNLNGGGGTQVADSFCLTLENFPTHNFVVVLPTALHSIACKIRNYPNVRVYTYTYPSKDWRSLLTGRNAFLDKLVDTEKIDIVFTIFAPMKWRPRVPHFAGFAISHLLMPESPYFKNMSFRQRISWKVTLMVWKFIFSRTDNFYTENPLITRRLSKLFPRKKICTITNCYNQVFDFPEKQKYHELPHFDGWQFLNVGSASPHKNLAISIEVARILKTDFKEQLQESGKASFRFVFTIYDAEFPRIPDDLKDCFLFIGRVDISEVPSLYQQSDVLFQPTLLECFTAVYPEAMRMQKPIITTDLEFAKGLCGEAALYYSAMDPYSAAESIIQVISNPAVRQGLVDRGVYELKKFDDYKTRSKKIIALCEQFVTSSEN